MFRIPIQSKSGTPTQVAHLGEVANLRKLVSTYAKWPTFAKLLTCADLEKNEVNHTEYKVNNLTKLPWTSPDDQKHSHAPSLPVRNI